ncbi:DUF6455 family protein [Shimia abyssi]|uniref:DUF6455 domain-containing protein n=1 Tax=Shimia abyssi TaxID=1662395 RepID=A0A2P8FJP1_9RHOB|nr:DUF6455 family protein [Shimia abyssi]PSL21937.1 hypothetical protein CLV88_101361 [Shimia abyssi]
MTQVQALGDAGTHFWLTRSVARTMGVSLSEAMAEGDLSAADYSALVTRCRACLWVSDCQAWLARQAPGQPCAPECCLHKAVFEMLAERQR